MDALSYLIYKLLAMVSIPIEARQSSFNLLIRQQTLVKARIIQAYTLIMLSLSPSNISYSYQPVLVYRSLFSIFKSLMRLISLLW